jgi:long-chain acyl-CoA synthetase
MMKSTYPVPYEMLRHWAQKTPDRVYLRQPVNRTYREKTWAQVHDEVLRLAAALRSMGLMKGERVAILSKNTAEWFIADFAIAAAGLVPAPIYFTAGADTIQYVLEHSEARAIFLGKLDDLVPASKAIPEGVIKIGMPYETVSCNFQMADLIAANEPLEDVHIAEMDDIFSLIYTSGVTGAPKGIMVSFRNIGYTSTEAVAKLEYTERDRLISYLPLAHITERAMVQHAGLFHGCSVSFTESLDTFAEDVRNASPTVFISVPRLWMKFQTGILSKIPQKRLDLLLRIPIASGIIKKKIRKLLGLGDARIVGSGAAPISPAVIHWFARLGIDITEGFGMSETSGLVTVNFPFEANKIGTVGRPARGSTLKISESGELLISGDGIAKGYFKDPNLTQETFRDGWLHTGDKGLIDADGCLRITGRVKEIFKTAKGKYVAPVPIESMIAENPSVEQMCVLGSGLAQPVAVVVLASHGNQPSSLDADRSGLSETLRNVNSRLEAHEKLSHFVVVKEPWTIENGLLTPTMKLKRNLLEKKYSDLIAMPIAKGQSVHFEAGVRQ